VNKTLTET